MKTRGNRGPRAVCKNNYLLWARRCLLKCQRGVGGARRDARRAFQDLPARVPRDLPLREMCVRVPPQSFVGAERAVFIIASLLRNSNPERCLAICVHQ